MELKNVRRNVIIVDYGEFEKLIKGLVPGTDYSFVAHTECGNGACCYYPRTGLNGDDTPKEGEFPEVTEWLDGNIDPNEWYPDVDISDLLAELANRGIIERGDYLIKVSW